MALRAYWSGDLAIGPWTIPVQAGKATQADDNDEQLKRLCSCHHQPFTRPKDECPGGMHPWSQAAEDREDEDLTEIVYGTPVETDEDGVVTKWAVLDQDKLDDIREEAKLEDLEVDPGDVVPIDQIPAHLFVGPWYLWPKVEKGKKGTKRLQTFSAIVRALEQAELAMVTIWTPRINSSPKLVAIYPCGDALMMVEMPFRPEVREPEEKVISHADTTVPEKAVEVVTAVLQEMQGDFSYGAYEDVTIKLRKRAIAEALAGKPITKREKVATVTDDEPDLMASLEASLAAVKSGALVSRRKKLAVTEEELDEKFGAEAPWDAEEVPA